MVTRKELFPLPRAVYVLQSGLVLNAFGNGAANPFLLVYLSHERGIPVGLAGLVTLVAAGSALAFSLVSGAAADRFGGKATVSAGLLASTVAFLLYPHVHTFWEALPAAILAGAGVGTWLTGQSALLAKVTPPALRPLAFAQQRVAANIGLGLGGLMGGIVIATSGFTTLFVANAVTFLVYAVFIAFVPDARPARREVNGGYREVLRDGAFVRLLAVNLAVVVAAVALLNGLVPLFAIQEGGIGSGAVGALFLVNSLVIIAFQIPVARLQQGRRRMTALAQMCALFAGALLVFELAGVAPDGNPALVLMFAGIVVYSFAECLYDAVQGPLTADLAGDRLTGRYLAASGFSWQLGFMVGPAAAAALFALEPLALWPVAACVCLVAGAAALGLEPRLPEHVRLTPVRKPAGGEERSPPAGSNAATSSG